jgi:hypothetical protein
MTTIHTYSQAPERWNLQQYTGQSPSTDVARKQQLNSNSCMMRYLAAFFGKVINSAVQKGLVNFLVNCVRRSELRCSGIHGWMGQTC